MPFVLQIGGERRRVEQVEDARDVEVARLGVERARRELAVAHRLGQRQAEEIAARRRDANRGQSSSPAGPRPAPRAGASRARAVTAAARVTTPAATAPSQRDDDRGTASQTKSLGVISGPFRRTRGRSHARPGGGVGGRGRHLVRRQDRGDARVVKKAVARRLQQLVLQDRAVLADADLDRRGQPRELRVGDQALGVVKFLRTASKIAVA